MEAAQVIAKFFSLLILILHHPGQTAATNYYVSPAKGKDAAGRGSRAHPFKTLAFAASQVPGGRNDTICLEPGIYLEGAAAILAPGVNIKGAGEDRTILTVAAPLTGPGIDEMAKDWKLKFEGSLIQLTSSVYDNDKLDSPARMRPTVDGNQTLSGFTIDGHDRQLKTGVWVENRNHVTMHHVTIRNCKLRGAVFAKGNMMADEALPDGKWMYDTRISWCTFINSGCDLPDESLGDLCIAGLDGAGIDHITIRENQGYGIKFIYYGHFRHLRIHDCSITVPESDPLWKEDISIELWNLSYDNEVYNIRCNTWLSFVNQVRFHEYEPTSTHPLNLSVHSVRLIDGDGKSDKESIECALSGVEIYDSYFRDKGLGIAIWGGAGWGGSIKLHDITIRNNLFVNIRRVPTFGFGNSSGVFIPDPVQGIHIFKNIFYRMGKAIQLSGADFQVRNNVFINTVNKDVEGGSQVELSGNLYFKGCDPIFFWPFYPLYR